MCDDIFISRRDHEKSLEKNSEKQDEYQNLPGFQDTIS
jgi:hypothetical protein